MDVCVSVLVAHDSGMLYMSQLHRQLQCSDRHSQCVHKLNELRLSVDINCAPHFPPSLFHQLQRFTEWKPDGSSLKTGQGGFGDNFTILFNKTLVKTVCFVRARSLLAVCCGADQSLDDMPMKQAED